MSSASSSDIRPAAAVSDRARPPVAVLGTGTMGATMARVLVAVGFPVHVWNRSPDPVAPLVARGATAHASAAEAAAAAPVVLSVLPTAEVTAAVVLDDGVLDAHVPGAVWAQMGTIGVDDTNRLADAVAARRPDGAFVDAPVSGSRNPAETGELVVLASGPDAAHPVLEPVFAAVGRRTLWLGPAGAGTRMKLVLNTWLAFEIEAASEAAALATRLGISSDELADAVSGSPLVSSFADATLAKIQSADHRPDFALGWALKDLHLAQSAAGPRWTPVADAIAARWDALVDAGYGALDVSAARLGLGEPPAIPGQRAVPAATDATDATEATDGAR